MRSQRKRGLTRSGFVIRGSWGDFTPLETTVTASTTIVESRHERAVRAGRVAQSPEVLASRLAEHWESGELTRSQKHLIRQLLAPITRTRS